MKRLFLILIAFFSYAALHAQQAPLVQYFDADHIYTTPVEVMPQFRAGEESLNFRLQHIRYIFADRMKNIQGKVLVSFIVEKDGTVSNAKVEHGLTQEEDNEVLRVINNLRKWDPGMKDGKPVRVQLSIPIDFKLIKS